MASTPLFIAAPPRQKLTIPSSPAISAGKFCLHPPDKLGNFIDRSKSVNHVLQIHAALLRHNLLLHDYPILNLKLHRAYASHGRIHHSLTIFHQTPNPDVFLFAAVINTVSIHGLHDQALLFYIQMLSDKVDPNEYIFSSLLKACSGESGKAIHAHVIKLGFGSDAYVTTGLVDFYTRRGNVLSAQKVFDRMPKRNLVSSTAMITCYTKQGNLKAARFLFNEMPERDIVSWNVMIDGYTQLGFPGDALLLFQKMLAQEKPKPDEITIVAILSACGQIGALESGRWIHGFIKNSRIKLNVRVCTALVDMYSKSGSLNEAWLVFKNTQKKDIVAWNAMIVGYSIHGYGQEALRLFDEMLRKGLHPTDVTYIGVLNACAHAGFVKLGLSFFVSMQEEYGIEPKIEHYGCLISLLGRAGELKKAYEIVKRMKLEVDIVLWSALLGSCRVHGDFMLGKEIGEYLISQNITNSGIYVMLSNIYASIGDFEGVIKVRNLMKEKGIEKEPGISCIEINNKVHEFQAGDRNHPKSVEIYRMVRMISKEIKNIDLEAVEKEQLLTSFD